MSMCQLFLIGYYFRSYMADEHVVVTLTFGLQVDVLDSFEKVQMKIKEIEYRQPCGFTNNRGSHVS